MRADRLTLRFRCRWTPAAPQERRSAGMPTMTVRLGIAEHGMNIAHRAIRRTRGQPHVAADAAHRSPSSEGIWQLAGLAAAAPRRQLLEVARRLAPRGPAGAPVVAPSAASRRTGASSMQRSRAAGLVVGARRARACARQPALARAGHRLPRRQRRIDRPARPAARFRASRATTRPRRCAACWIISASRGCAPSSAPPTAAWWPWPLPSAIRERVERLLVHQRRRSHPSDGDRLAQRAAAHRALCAVGRAVRARAWSSRARSRWRPIAARRSSPRALRSHRSLAEGRFVFPVEQYLFARGRDYAARYLPESFLCLSESIDLHAVDARAHRRADHPGGGARGPARAARGHARAGRASAARAAARDFLAPSAMTPF